MENIRDFPHTKLDNRKNSPLVLNEHSDPRFFLQLFAKNSVMKNIFEAEKKFFENSSQLGVFWPMRGLPVNHGTALKGAIFPQPGNQERLK